MAAIDDGKTATIVIEEPPTSGKENSSVKRKSESDSPGRKMLKEDVCREVTTVDENLKAESGDKVDAIVEEEGTDSLEVPVPNYIPKSDVVEPTSHSSSEDGEAAEPPAVNEGVKSGDDAEVTESNKEEAKQEEQPTVVDDAEATA